MLDASFVYPHPSSLRYPSVLTSGEDEVAIKTESLSPPPLAPIAKVQQEPHAQDQLHALFSSPINEHDTHEPQYSPKRAPVPVEKMNPKSAHPLPTQGSHYVHITRYACSLQAVLRMYLQTRAICQQVLPCRVMRSSTSTISTTRQMMTRRKRRPTATMTNTTSKARQQRLIADQTAAQVPSDALHCATCVTAEDCTMPRRRS